MRTCMKHQLLGIPSVIMHHWPIALVVLSIPGTLVIGTLASKETVALFSTSVLLATLIAVTWYSYETRALRLEQEANAETEHHPWIGIELRGSERQNETDTLITRENFHFGVRNSGTTPAYDVTIKGRWSVRDEHGADQPSDNFEFSLGVLLPNTVSACDVPIHWELVGSIDITFDLTYKTFHGGGGFLQYNCRFEQPGRLISKNESLEFWLSNGARFPAKRPDSESPT